MVWGNLATGYWLGAAAAAGLHWVELDRETLTGTSDNVDTGTFTTKPYLMILSHLPCDVNTNEKWQFNNDSGNNYALRASQNGATDNTGTSQPDSQALVNHDVTGDHFGVWFINNNSSQEKLCVNHVVQENTSGAGTAPTRSDGVMKWANTSAQINRVKAFKTSSTDYNVGSEVVVLGCDPDDTEGTSVWEELKSVSLSSGADTLDTGSFTSKKYLWIQAFIPEGAAHHGYIYFNNDTGANYARRGSINAGSDITTAPDNEINWSHATNSAKYLNMFVINKSDKEKLCIAEYMDYNSAGAGNAANRIEWVYKWANTSAQISSVKLYNQENSSTDFPSGTLLKVWGFD